MNRLAIRLLGRFEVSKADELPELELTSTCQKLLAYLLLNRGKLCRREVLMEVFWSDKSPERARSCLNSALWRLRHALGQAKGADYLVTTELSEVGFNWECDYWLDVQLFEQKLLPLSRKSVVKIEADEVAQMENLLALYRGELLTGIYEDWALVEREQLRMIYINALTQLMTYYANCNAFEKSIEFARAILKEDPLREDIHRSMMRFYMLTGQRPLGVQQYRSCVSILDNELGVPPMEETQRLYQQIMGQSTLQQSAIMGNLHAQSDLEQYLQTVVRNLDQAHTLLRQAAHLMAYPMHVGVDR